MNGASVKSNAMFEIYLTDDEGGRLCRGDRNTRAEAERYADWLVGEYADEYIIGNIHEPATPVSLPKEGE